METRMGATERRFAGRAIQWVMCSYKPLTTDELPPAIWQDEYKNTLSPVDVDFDEDTVLEYCHNILVVDSIRKVWVPSHLSVTEYFEKFFWSQKAANCLVSSVCLLLLNNDRTHEQDVEKQSRKQAASSDSLGEKDFTSLRFYASHHWMRHVRNCLGPRLFE